jgi:bacillithiol biosynthesis deacetylase BshB1
MSDVDVMAFGAHPDDIELGCGGTLIKLVDKGRSVVLVDMTRGEMSTRGTVETRGVEAAAAARIIGAVSRENLYLPDGDVRLSAEAKRRVVTIVRKYRPQLVLIPYYEDRHPDHYHASDVAYEGIFAAGLARYDTRQAYHRPSKVLYYMRWDEFTPSFVIDITAQFERKMEAVYAYTSQFRPDDARYQQTRLTSPQFEWELVHRMAYHGSLIQVRYGEAFLVRGHLEVDDPLQLRFSSF